MNTTITDSTIQAYLQTEYIIHSKPPVVLRINDAPANLAPFFPGDGINSMAYITASNPRSRILSAETNMAANRQLQAELDQRGFRYISGHAHDPGQQWPDEAGFLIDAISLSEARTLGARYEQNAIVFIDIDQMTRLILLR